MLLFVLGVADIAIQPWTAVYIAYLLAPLFLSNDPNKSL